MRKLLIISLILLVVLISGCIQLKINKCMDLCLRGKEVQTCRINPDNCQEEIERYKDGVWNFVCDLECREMYERLGEKQLDKTIEKWENVITGKIE